MKTAYMEAAHRVSKQECSTHENRKKEISGNEMCCVVMDFLIERTLPTSS